MKKLALGILAVIGIGIGYMGVAYADDGSGSGSLAGSGSALVQTPADAGPAVVAPAPAAPSADQLHDPAESPRAAFDELKAAKKLGWGVAVFAGLAMLFKVLAYVKDKLAGKPVIGKVAAFLAKGKTAIWIAGLGAGCAAAYNALAEGGTWMAAVGVLVVKAFALMSPTTAAPAKS